MKIYNSLIFLLCFFLEACNKEVKTVEIETKPSEKEEITFTPEQLKLPGKKGASFSLKEGNENLESHLKMTKDLNPYWNYSWNYNYVSGQPADIQFVPMTVCSFDKNDFLTKVRPLVMSGKVRMVLGYNEPDTSSQHPMSVEEALDLWPTLESLNIPLGSPSAANARGEWFEQFMKGAEARGYRVDFVCIHVYISPNVDGLKKYVDDVYNKFKKPIMVTEFAARYLGAETPEDNKLDPAKVLQFMKDALDYMENDDRVIGYAWFPYSQDSPEGCKSALFDDNGELTELGRFYAEYPNNTDIEGGEGEGDDEYVQESYDPGIIKNGDFESDIAVNWELSSTAVKISKSNNDTGIISGDATLMFGPSSWSEAKQIVDVMPGATYNFGFAGRTQDSAGESGTIGNTSNSKCTMAVKYIDVNGKTQKLKDISCASSYNKGFTDTVEIPTDVTSIIISIWSQAKNSYSYIDDVFFVLNE